MRSQKAVHGACEQLSREKFISFGTYMTLTADGSGATGPNIQHELGAAEALRHWRLPLNLRQSRTDPGGRHLVFQMSTNLRKHDVRIPGPNDHRCGTHRHRAEVDR